MTDMKLYTAVGRFLHKQDSTGQYCPIIILGNREYLVDPQEFMIWINANWRICRWEEIGKYYASSAAESIDRPILRLNPLSHSFIRMEPIRIRMEAALNSTGSGCRIFSNEEVPSS